MASFRKNNYQRKTNANDKTLERVKSCLLSVQMSLQVSKKSYLSQISVTLFGNVSDFLCCLLSSFILFKLTVNQLRTNRNIV